MNENIQNETPADVPYIVYEAALARQEEAHKREREKDQSTIKRLITAIIVVSIAFTTFFIGFLVYESQFETVSYTQDGEGLNNINTGEQGDVYGTDGQNQAEEKRQD